MNPALYDFLTEERDLFIGEGTLTCRYRIWTEAKVYALRWKTPIERYAIATEAMAYVRQVARGPWTPTKLSERICEDILNDSFDGERDSVEPHDYWMVGRLIRYIRALPMTKRKDVAYLTKSTSPRQLEIPPFLLVHRQSFDGALKAIDAFKKSGTIPDFSAQQEINGARDFLLTFWSYIAEQYVNGDLELYETAQDIYETISIKIPHVCSPGIW